MSMLFKKTFIIVLCVTVVFSAITVALAATVLTENGFTIRVDDDGYTRLNNWSGEGVMRIPSTIMNHYVNEIEDYSFTNNKAVTGLNVESVLTLRRIGKYAFAGSGLCGDLVIPNYITSIDVSAFQSCPISTFTMYSGVRDIPEQLCYSCKQLNEVSLNYGVQKIGRLAFAKCSSLEKVTINWTVTDIDSTAFYNSPNVVIYCYTDSYAHQYAEEKGIDYVLIDAPAPTEPPTEEPTTAPTEAPTLEPTEAPTEPIAPILGDTDGNGVIEVDDATYIQRVVAELPVPYPMETIMYGDVDGDGELTITDATLIQRYVAEMPVNYPIGEPIAK